MSLDYALRPRQVLRDFCRLVAIMAPIPNSLSHWSRLSPRLLPTTSELVAGDAAFGGGLACECCGFAGQSICSKSAVFWLNWGQLSVVLTA